MYRLYGIATGLLAMVVAIWLPCVSCGLGSQDDFKLETISPQAGYEVKLEGKVNPANPNPGEFYVRQVRLQAFKGNKSVLVDENFYREGPYEEGFLKAFPIRNWVNNYTLRLGDDSKQPFRDEIVISNNSGTKLDVLIVRYGKYERFIVFDVIADDSIRLEASPQSDREYAPSGVSYTAYANGRAFSGSTADFSERRLQKGPLKLLVRVKKSS